MNIKWKTVIIGIIIAIMLMFILEFLIGNGESTFSIILAAIFVGYWIGGNYNVGAINGAIMGVIIAILNEIALYSVLWIYVGGFGSFGNPLSFIILAMTIISLGIFGAIGGVIGIFIKGKTSNDNTD